MASFIRAETSLPLRQSARNTTAAGDAVDPSNTSIPGNFVSFCASSLMKVRSPIREHLLHHLEFPDNPCTRAEFDSPQFSNFFQQDVLPLLRRPDFIQRLPDLLRNIVDMS